MNRAWSLSLSPQEVSQITSIFRDQLHRNPTDVELMDYIQSNNEHCRHFLLNGKIILNGEPQPLTMLQLLRSAGASATSAISTFGKDGAAIRGTLAETLNAANPAAPSPTVARFENKNPVITLTTHNFPCGVTPFSGAE